MKLLNFIKFVKSNVGPNELTHKEHRKTPVVDRHLDRESSGPRVDEEWWTRVRVSLPGGAQFPDGFEVEGSQHCLLFMKTSGRWAGQGWPSPTNNPFEFYQARQPGQFCA